MIKKIQIKENQVDEARQMHTWNITYTGKGNKPKTHMVDAPDAYEANRKARRELGIAYTDIDDVTMVENKETVTESIENEYGETLYRFVIGSGFYRPYVFYAYGYNEQDALDKIINQLERDDNSNIYTVDEIENEGIYEDEYVIGGNHSVALYHYGEFRIETPDNDDMSDGQLVTENMLNRHYKKEDVTMVENKEINEAIDTNSFKNELKTVYNILEEVDDYIDSKDLTAEEEEYLIKYGEMISYFANKYLNMVEL